MKNNREKVLAILTAELPSGSDGDSEIGDDMSLSEMGVTSMNLITIIISLQREYSIDIGSLVKDGLPTTVGDLVGLTERNPAQA